jgi:membrane protein implicated in regulation of membrane protease activity
VFVLEQAIVDGRGRLKIGDAFWAAEGPDLAQGTRVRVVGADNMSLQVVAAD